MSSHHIIRSKQEPALMIANGSACKMDLLNDLLEWSPFVLVLDGAYNRFKDLEIKADAILGDFDSIKNLEEIEQKQQPIEIVHAPDQNKTDLEKGIEYLIENKHEAVNIIWATGKRLDHTLANLNALIKYQNQIKIVVLDDYGKFYLLSKYFEKWFQKGQNISLFPFNEAKNIKTKNLKYPLKNETLSLGKRIGTSNEVLDDGLVKIKFDSGNLLMLECWD